MNRGFKFLKAKLKKTKIIIQIIMVNSSSLNRKKLN